MKTDLFKDPLGVSDTGMAETTVTGNCFLYIFVFILIFQIWVFQVLKSFLHHQLNQKN